MSQINGNRSEIVCVKEDLKKSITLKKYLEGSHLGERAGLSCFFSFTEQGQGGEFIGRQISVQRKEELCNYQIEELGCYQGIGLPQNQESSEFSFLVNILTN